MVSLTAWRWFVVGCELCELDKSLLQSFRVRSSCAELRFSLFFLTYVTVIVFAVIRVITAVFLKAARRNSRHVGQFQVWNATGSAPAQVGVVTLI